MGIRLLRRYAPRNDSLSEHIFDNHYKYKKVRKIHRRCRHSGLIQEDAEFGIRLCSIYSATVRIILPMCLLLSINLCDSAASSRGKRAAMTGLISPLSISGQI
jgi:hypothetical protein